MEKITPLYSNLVKKIFDNIKSGKSIKSYEQDHSKATYSLWRDEKDYFIDWNNKASTLKRKIDASGYPYQGACTMYNGYKIIINNVEIIEDRRIVNRESGKIIFVRGNSPAVVCGEGLLLIKEAVYTDGTDALPFKKFRTRLISQT